MNCNQLEVWFSCKDELKKAPEKLNFAESRNSYRKSLLLFYTDLFFPGYDDLRLSFVKNDPARYANILSGVIGFRFIFKISPVLPEDQDG